MKLIFAIVFTTLFAAFAMAQSVAENALEQPFPQADMEDLSQFKWKNRLVLVFADSENDPAFIEQIELLRERLEELEARDVVVLVDTDPDARRPIRLRMRPRGFMLVIVGKDGQVKLRKPFPWDVREISRSIDKMPIRQREIRENRSG